MSRGGDRHPRVLEQRQLLSKHREVNARLFHALQSRPARITISAAAGTVLAASVAATTLTLSAPAGPAIGMASDLDGASGPLGTSGPSGPSIADETGREMRQDQARAQAARTADVTARARAAARLAARQRREAAERAAQERQAAQEAQRQQASSQRATAASGAPAVPSGSPQQVAMSMLASYGWSSSEFGCLDSLWERESGWNPGAENPASGAYGIPQALPGSKMASAGADWATNPATQIRWGLGYIKSLYGSPCGAWDHELADGWY